MKEDSISKGMVLCAGLGTRLLPVTEKIPKPMVPVLNIPNILHNLFLLKRAGIQEVIVNLYHLPDVLERFLGTGERWGMKLAYSRETRLLGTGGGLKKAEAFFEGKPLVLANCDFVTDAEIKPFIEKFFEQKALATMLLIEDETIQPFFSKVGADKNGHLCSLPSLRTGEPTRTGIFTGIHLLDNAVFNYLSEVPCGINEVFYPKVMKESSQRVFTEFLVGNYWHDTGDRSAFWTTSMKLLDSLSQGDRHIRELMIVWGDYEEKAPGVWMPKRESVPAKVNVVGPVVIGSHCRFGNHVTVGPHTVLGDGSEVGDGAAVSHFVGLGASRIKAGSRVDGLLQFEETVLSHDRKPK